MNNEYKKYLERREKILARSDFHPDQVYGLFTTSGRFLLRDIDHEREGVAKALYLYIKHEAHLFKRISVEKELQNYRLEDISKLARTIELYLHEMSLELSTFFKRKSEDKIRRLKIGHNLSAISYSGSRFYVPSKSPLSTLGELEKASIRMSERFLKMVIAS